MSGKISSYKDLQVWVKSIQLVREVYILVKRFPEDEKFGLTPQMKRSSISVPSNIAEGWGRGTRKQFINGLNLARGSLMELETQLILAKELKFIESITPMDSQINELSKMLNSLIDKLRAKG